jgi:hypothetical protein
MVTAILLTTSKEAEGSYRVYRNGERTDYVISRNDNELEAGGDPRIAWVLEQRRQDGSFADDPPLCERRTRKACVSWLAGHLEREAIKSEPATRTQDMSEILETWSGLKVGDKVRASDTKGIGVVQSLYNQSVVYVRWQSGPTVLMSTSQLKKVIVTSKEARQLRAELKALVSQAGDIVSVKINVAEKGWTAVLSTEYAALKVYYHHRSANVAMDRVNEGWAVSVRA